MRKPAPPSRPKKDAQLGIRISRVLKDAAFVAALAERRNISDWVEGVILDAVSRSPPAKRHLEAADRRYK